MRALAIVCVGFSLVSVDAHRQLAAQEVTRRNQFALDASLFAGGLSYARITRSGNVIGVGAGMGVEFNFRLVRGERGGKKSTEVAHIEMFTRLAPPGRWQYDLGLKAAVDIHSAQVASEAEPGGFFGGYVAPMWGGRRFRIGPRLQAGAYWTSSVPTVGVFVTPIMVRLLF